MKGYKIQSSVKEMIGLEITGNVIPPEWYQHLRRENGKPYSIAIELLADIVYWYRPVQIRDETTGKLVGYAQKFKSDKLQRSYQAFSEMYGYTKDQVRDALTYLAEKQVIDLDFRHPAFEGIKYGNLLYIGLNVETLRKINLHLSDLNPIGYQEEIREGIGFKSDTNTETTPETTLETSKKQTPLPLPQTPLEASQHPDIQLFKKVSGVFPGLNDYRMIIDAATLLRRAHPDEGELESYLLPFWLRWQGLKRKDGKPANKTNPTWFTEWAVNNYTPTYEPEKVPVVVNDKHARSRAALEQVRAELGKQNAN